MKYAEHDGKQSVISAHSAIPVLSSQPQVVFSLLLVNRFFSFWLFLSCSLGLHRDWASQQARAFPEESVEQNTVLRPEL